MSSTSAVRYSARRLIPSRHSSQVTSRAQGLSSLAEQTVSGSRKTGYIAMAISGQISGIPDSHSAGSSAPGQRVPTRTATCSALLSSPVSLATRAAPAVLHSSQVTCAELTARREARVAKASMLRLLTSSKVTSLSMLAFATLASLLAVSSAQVTCDECKTAGAAMVARLTSEESIAEQVAVLVGTLCPGAQDPAGCEAGIPAAWPEIAMAMYPVFLEPETVCSANDDSPCAREITCELCLDGIGRLEAYLTAQEVDIIAFLQGEAFCGNHPEVETCPEDVDGLIRAAVPILGAAFVEAGTEICQDIAGVC